MCLYVTIAKNISNVSSYMHVFVTPPHDKRQNFLPNFRNPLIKRTQSIVHTYCRFFSKLSTNVRSLMNRIQSMLSWYWLCAL